MTDQKYEIDELLKQLQQRSNKILELEERCKHAEHALTSIEKTHKALLENIPFAVFTVNNHGSVIYSNPKANQLLWPLIDKLESISVFENQSLLGGSVVDKLRSYFEQNKPIVTGCSHTDEKDKVGYLRYHLTPVFESDNRVSVVIILVEDITELKEVESAVKESESKSRLLFQFAPIAMIERDASELRKYIDHLSLKGVIDLEEYFTDNPEEVFHCLKLIKTVDYNKAYLKLLEAQNIEEVYKSLAKGTREEHLSFARNIILMIADGAVWEEREEYLTTVKGNRRCVLGKSLVIKGHEDRLSSVIMTLTDITKLKEAQEALRASEQRYRQQSLRDNLTGLYNRRYLYSSLSKLMEASKTEGMNLSVLFIDLDDFKQVVDTYGHLNGSQAIQEIAGTIRECLEEPAYAVSYAGDEFIVVLPAADNIQAIEKASEIRLRISSTNYLKSQGIQAKLSASFGIATFPDHGSDLRGLLASADAALFEAKRSFKGAVKSAKKKVVKRGYY